MEDEQLPAICLGFLALLHLLSAMAVTADFFGRSLPIFLIFWVNVFYINIGFETRVDRMHAELYAIFLLLGLAFLLRYLAEGLWKRNAVAWRVSVVLCGLFSLATIPVIFNREFLISVKQLDWSNLGLVVGIFFLSVLPSWITLAVLIFTRSTFLKTPYGQPDH